jgi:hypothetical protein
MMCCDVMWWGTAWKNYISIRCAPHPWLDPSPSISKLFYSNFESVLKLSVMT